MWPLILIIALVPMVFFWSDSARELLPALAPYLPDKTEPLVQAPGSAPGTPAAAGAPTEWVIPESESGYVAWLISGNGQYRLAVGCRQGDAPSLQVTAVHADTGQQAAATVVSGDTWLKLEAGRYFDDGKLIGAIAQFGQVNLVVPGPTGPQAIGQFSTHLWHSGVVARGLQQHCA